MPINGGGGKPEPDVDYLCSILKTFNELFGDIDRREEDKIGKFIAEDLPKIVVDEKALEQAVIDLLSEHTELFKQFSDNSSFRELLSDHIFARTYQKGAGGGIHSGP